MNLGWTRQALIKMLEVDWIREYGRPNEFGFDENSIDYTYHFLKAAEEALDRPFIGSTRDDLNKFIREAGF